MTVNIDQAVSLRNNMRQQGVVMAYNGAISDDLMLTLAEVLKGRTNLDKDPRRSKTLFAVFMKVCKISSGMDVKTGRLVG